MESKSNTQTQRSNQLWRLPHREAEPFTLRSSEPNEYWDMTLEEAVRLLCEKQDHA
ncbi:MAG: hypothetical protein R3C28_07895 [Pirellulaceae bacterium]